MYIYIYILSPKCGISNDQSLEITLKLSIKVHIKPHPAICVAHFPTRDWPPAALLCGGDGIGQWRLGNL